MTRLTACLPLAVALLAAPPAPAPASQKPCRDAQGKVIKCPKPRAASPRCKDAAGKFVACKKAKAGAGS